MSGAVSAASQRRNHSTSCSVAYAAPSPASGTRLSSTCAHGRRHISTCGRGMETHEAHAHAVCIVEWDVACIVNAIHMVLFENTSSPGVRTTGRTGNAPQLSQRGASCTSSARGADAWVHARTMCASSAMSEQIQRLTGHSARLYFGPAKPLRTRHGRIWHTLTSSPPHCRM